MCKPMRHRPLAAAPKRPTSGPLGLSARAAGATLAVALTLLGSPRLSHAADAAPASAQAMQDLVTEPIYDGGLKGKWEDQGWAPRDTNGQHARLDFADLAGWILVHRGPVTPANSLMFKLRAPATHGDFLEVHLGGQSDDNFPRVAVLARHRHALAEGTGDWVQVRLPLSELNPKKLPFDRLTVRARRAVPSAWVELSQLGFANPIDGSGALTQAFETRRINLQIDGSKAAHAINPLIYGIAFNPRKNQTDAYQWQLGVSARRWGGNPATRYNWRLGNAWNTAADWFFMNVNYTPVSNYSWSMFLDENKSHHVQSAITLPMLGWVAKDTSSYSYPVSVYGPQRGHYGQAGDVGNGVRPDGKFLPGSEPRRTSIKAAPNYAAEWVEAILDYDADHQAGRSVSMYFLDNEPELWNSTHQDLHPDPLTYDELVSRSLALASEVRAVDPCAHIAGPSSWGWPAYFYSAADAVAGFSKRPDRMAHKDVPLLAYYLQQMRANEQKTGTKLLNTLDVHFYPESEGVHGGHERFDDATSAKRIRATRALWDPTYKDESWIADTVKLIPRLKSLVAENYPGLGLSLGEYNFGGEKHMSGALAQALALGRFGQQGLDAAFYWTYPPEGSPVYHAFRAFRNFDGEGAQFLDQSLVTMEDKDVSLFASTNAERDAVVAIAVNTNPTEGADADLDLTGTRRVEAGRIFQYRGGSQGMQQVGEAVPRPGLNSVRLTLPPYSITVIDLKLQPR
jgi:hypothetical protein